MKKRFSPRLRSFDYKGSYVYFVTLCTYKREKHFENKEIVNFVLTHLKECCYNKKHNYKIYAYCFMPEHLHLLIQGEETSDFKKFMKEFKQKTEFHFKKIYKDRLWHLSYYDHILRKEEDIKDIALYIFNNSVRKEIVDDFKKYNYLGSFVFDIKEM